jgi:uncharacterized protein (DUF1778 family)
MLTIRDLPYGDHVGAARRGGSGKRRIDGGIDQWQFHSMPATAEKTSRLELDMPVEILSTIQKAADMQGRPLEDFVVEAAHRQAREILAVGEDAPIRLNREQAEHILELIENPPEPNAAMLEAVALHRKLVRA